MLAAISLTTSRTGAGGATGAPWGHQKYQQVSLRGHSKSGCGLAIYTSGLNCNWLKVIIASEVMVFLAFCSLRLCCYKVCLSGTVFVVAPSKCVNNCCIPY